MWILDGDLYHKGLLKFAVSAESLPETLVIFVADMSRPWTVMESLQKWASVLREHIDKMKIPPEEMRELERKCKYNRIFVIGKLTSVYGWFKPPSFSVSRGYKASVMEYVVLLAPFISELLLYIQ